MKALFDQSGFPFLRWITNVQRVPFCRLRPGAKVIQIGTLAASKKETSSCRVQRFRAPIIYRGKVRVSNIPHPQLAFQYKQDNKRFYLLYGFGDHEVYLLNYRTSSIRIHKAEFKIKK
jgi:hypothetical protein